MNEQEYSLSLIEDLIFVIQYHELSGIDLYNTRGLGPYIQLELYSETDIIKANFQYVFVEEYISIELFENISILLKKIMSIHCDAWDLDSRMKSDEKWYEIRQDSKTVLFELRNEIKKSKFLLCNVVDEEVV